MTREEAITRLKSKRDEVCNDCLHAVGWCEAHCGFLEAVNIAIEALRQPEPHEGHWIPHESPDGGEQYECSECGVLWEFNDGTPEDNEAYFCPKCGARMKGEENEAN